MYVRDFELKVFRSLINIFHRAMYIEWMVFVATIEVATWTKRESVRNGNIAEKSYVVRTNIQNINKMMEK